MIKVSFFRGTPDVGQVVFPLFLSSRADGEFEKKAESVILPDVAKYIARLKPVTGSQYVLVNAMGAGEFYGSNINGDHFPEASLIHCPDKWHSVPDIDKLTAKDWPYGFPTFYNAHPFMHHRNKDPLRAYGEVELSTWNNRMKRVELIIRVDKDKCDKFGGTGIWDKLKMGMYPDVSMGSKVPFDTCSICLDWDEYRKAQQTFEPGRHKHPGEAVLAYHKSLIKSRWRGIRGLSITRKDYCEHASKHMNKILPDGRKIFVYNDYPRFFDISFVFIGADKTAKVMMKVASDERVWSLPSADLAEHLGYDEQDGSEKTASVDEDILKEAFLGKSAKMKRGEIEKHGPTQFDSKAVPLITKNESSLSHDQMDEMCEHPLDDILSSSTSMGMVLRPREFQRIIIIKMGLRPMADDLEDKNVVFPKVDTHGSGPDLGHAVPRIISLLSSLFSDRSALSPALDKRIARGGSGHVVGGEKKASSHPTTLLNKIGSAYAGYRQGVMNYWTQDRRSDLEKTASSLSPHTFEYLKHAYWNEVGRL